jgi:uncharacterized protein
MKYFLFRQGLILFLVLLFVRGLIKVIADEGTRYVSNNPIVSIHIDRIVPLFTAILIIIVFKWVQINREIGLIIPTSKRVWCIWIPTLIIPSIHICNLNVNFYLEYITILVITALGVSLTEEILFRVYFTLWDSYSNYNPFRFTRCILSK